MKTIEIFSISCLLLIFSCGKEDKNNNPKACFDKTIEGAIVDFNTNCSEGADEFLWKFGDGATTFRENPTHTYDDPGDYTVTLIITSSSGIQDSVSETINIELLKVSLECTFSNGAMTQGISSGTKQEVEVIIENERNDCESDGGTFEFEYL